MIKLLNSSFSLILWVFSLLLVGAIIGNLSKSGVDSWYLGLNRSPLTPPNYVFGIAWTFLYVLIAISGWIIWNHTSANLLAVKRYYIAQLLLNWSWTPLFFIYHLTAVSLLCIVLITIIAMLITVKIYNKSRLAALLFVPYIVWLLFATYLNYYIWQYN